MTEDREEQWDDKTEVWKDNRKQERSHRESEGKDRIKMGICGPEWDSKRERRTFPAGEGRMTRNEAGSQRCEGIANQQRGLRRLMHKAWGG